MSPTKQPSPNPKSTKLWSSRCREKGQWFQVPKVLFRKFGELKIKPQHLWLLLALQFDRYQDRPHRYYWDELAAFLEPNEKLRPSARNRVRRWAYELRDLGLLKIKSMRRQSPGDTRGRDYRNERNIFTLEAFEAKVDDLQIALDGERAEREEKRSKGKRTAI